MRFARPVRLPLQIGAGAAWNMARSSLAMLMLLAMSLGHGIAFLMFGGVLGITLGFVLLFYAAMSAAAGLMAWPTDLVMDTKGFRVHGGIDEPVSLRWDELAAETCKLEEKQEHQRSLAKTVTRTIGVVVFSFLIIPVGMIVLLIDKFRPVKNIPVPDLEEGHTTIWTLVVTPKSGKPISLGEGERPIERASLGAVLETLRAAAGIRSVASEGPVPSKGPSLLRCPSCGAAALLASADFVACRYCGTQVEVPEDLRARLEHADRVVEERHRSEALVQKLLEQPVAERASRYVNAGAWLMHLAWLGALGMTIHLWWRERLDWHNTLMFIGSAAALIATAFVVMRFALVDRHALRLLTVELGATPDEALGVYDCRACGAPLAAKPNRLLARCAYCDTDNILGIDLYRRLVPSLGRVRTLEEALGERFRERLLWGALLVISPALLWLAWQSGYSGYQYRTPFAAMNEACFDGSAKECLTLGRMHASGEGAVDDHNRALELFERACEAGSAEGCYEAGDADDYFTEDDDSEDATVFYQRACSAGHAQGCVELGNRRRQGRGTERDESAAVRAYERACDAGSAVGCARANGER
jgi:hypothetical protein